METYKSDAQVRKHLNKYSAEEHKEAKHEAKESKAFEKAEHRLAPGKIGRKKHYKSKGCK